ncbi:MAG: amino acid permease [Acidobacteria bacterium RIFCSPLOWO2_02_FULL_68_18]|nr:MAG: amino acid permease [Acidobacteria bacterium RIFCSPLOWO2_02_FULL_68_18]OFW49481.1 MAG: amino acid permease [Acidobacteria bacterium RIFCSPLOWO2_12_FULL_68_19]
MDSHLLKTKSIEQLVGDVERGGKALRRTLTAMDLTLLGIGAIIGTGIFVLTGTAAANQAGPAITVSYLVAGLACAFAALCYAEFAAMIPIAGSAYTYAYATLGEIFAWMIGWDLILEYAVGSMTVAIGWSGYFQRILAGFGLDLPVWMTAAPAAAPGAVVNLPAVIIVLLIMILLVVGIRESARFNAVMVAIKVVAVLFFLATGVWYVRPENWTPFMPYAWSGVMTGAAVVFFAYIGFDAISTTAEEARNPRRDLPIGIIASLVICTVLYVAVAAVLSGIIPVVEFRDNAQFLNAPVAYALAVTDLDWAAGLVSAGAVAGITSVLLVMLMSQPRIFFSMSRDGLLPPGVSKVHPRFQTPYITTIITCVIVAITAGLVPIQVVGEMTSIGTLFAFVVVCTAVVVLRVTRPDAHRPFRVPGGAVIPVLGVLSCLYLMVSLSVMTWVRLLVWLDIGMFIYWFYGRTHSPLADPREAATRSSLESLGDRLTVAGYVLLFNGAAIVVLALLTEWGVTSEALARWSELDALTSRVGMEVTPQLADRLGLGIIGLGFGVTIAGLGIARVGSGRMF